MRKWWRKLKAALGLGLTWGLAWFGVGMAILLVVGPDAADVPFPLGFGLFGFLTGVSFSGLLGLIEGRRTFDQMSIPRFAAWGGAGGLLFASVFTLIAARSWDIFVVVAPVFGIAGAICAAGTLALARKGDDRELLKAAAEVDAVGLTEEETKELLG